MRCVFCQNSEIASGNVAKEISSERLTEIFLELQEKKASNINLVTPTHFVPLIIPALTRAKDQGLIIPIVYNTSSYENVDTLKSLEGLIDIYLPDCKYYSDDLAIRYSSAPGYFDIAVKAIGEMLRQVGDPLFFPEYYHPYLGFPEDDQNSSTLSNCFDDHFDSKSTYLNNKGNDCLDTKFLTSYDYNLLLDGCSDDYFGPLMKSGVIIRHLMLPGGVEDSRKVIHTLLDKFENHVYLSIMNQFTPHGDLSAFPELLNPIDPREYDKLIDYSIDCGIENGFFQGEGTDLESFIPDFDFEGL